MDTRRACALVAHALHFSLSEILDLELGEFCTWLQEALWVLKHCVARW